VFTKVKAEEKPNVIVFHRETSRKGEMVASTTPWEREAVTGVRDWEDAG